MRYIDGETSEIQEDWRIKQLKVSGSGYNRFSVSDDGNPQKPVKSTDNFRGTYSLQYEVNASQVKERIEHKFANIEDADALTFENERYCGFAMKMDAAKFDDLTGSLIFWQAWQGTPYNPPVCLKFMTQKNASGEHRVKLAIRNNDTGALGGTELDAGSCYLAKGVWHTFQIYIKPRYNTEDGSIIVWIDGEQKLLYSGKIGYTPDPPTGTDDADYKYDGLVCKWGIYQPDANTGHRLLFDEIKYGTTFASVQPLGETTNTKEAISNQLITINRKEIKCDKTAIIKIFDSKGICVLNRSTKYISLETLPSGFYLLSILMDNELIARKIILK